MSQFSEWFNYEASLKILVFSMLAGAALPGLFAVGIRLQAAGSGNIGADGVAAHEKNQVLAVLAWVIYALVVAVIVIGVLFVARDFIAHNTGYPFLGAKPK
jgi:hypothetical protein